MAILDSASVDDAKENQGRMAIKFSIQGLLIYTAMLLYLLAFATGAVRLRKLAGFIYTGGFAAALAAVIYRAWCVGYMPFSNLFEVFVFLGMLMYPLTLFCRHVLGIDGGTGDMLIALVFLFPAGFVFGAEPRKLPPALQSPLFIPHVAAYMAGYAIITKAALIAIGQLTKGGNARLAGRIPREDATYRLVCLGFPLLTVGLVLGAAWGKLAWGDWWNWDPKELFSLSAWLVFVGYFHFRYMSGSRYPRVSAAIVMTGMVLIIVTLLWVNLARLFAGLHSYA